MSRNIGIQSNSEASESARESGREPGLLESARLLERELRSIVHDHLLLAALETRRAGESLVRIIAMGLISAGLLFTAWLALISAVVFALIQNSLMSPVVALLLVFVAHAVLAVVLVLQIRKRSRYLMFPETIGQLKPSTSAYPDAEPAT
jgi:uncharacterized membrane protein YqjE